MATKIPQDVRERQLRELAEADGYSFVGWVDGYKGSKSRMVINCPEHGSWHAAINAFLHGGTRCAKCSYDRNRTLNRNPRDAREKQLTELATANGYTFVGWVDGYRSAESRIIIQCAIHGDWHRDMCYFVNGYGGCPGCRDDRQSISPDARERQIKELAEADGYVFVGWVDDYMGVWSKIIINCLTHGDWYPSVSSFVHASSRCPSCAVTGYRPSKPGTLYALLSDCESMVKIGISNIPKQRHVDLKRETPFKFSVHREIHCDDGTIPPMLEQMFHDEFPSAGLRGFDGATEWRLWHDDVNTWFDLLSG